MKKLILPAVISLVFTSGSVFAEEVAQEATPAPAPVVMAPPPMAVPPPINPEMDKYRQEIEKRIATQQANMEKRMADQQAAMKERMVEQQAAMKKQIEQQQKKYQNMMEKRQAKMQEMQKRHEKMRTENTPPAWVNQTAPVAPKWNMPYAQQPRHNYRHTPMSNMSNRNGYHANVEKSLQNIEKLLGEVIEILQKK
ncbi:MAG: hypothetical protein KAG43_07410 [Candidatus Marithrix sp.]|nr:hypothetical protein [Candidatus Marithrix sp.]